MTPVTGSEFCFAHDPARARQRAEARKLGGRNRRTPRGGQPAGVVSLRSVADIQQHLEREYADVLLQENSSQRARTVGYLLGLALRALEVGEFEERLAAIEQRLESAPPPLRRIG